LAFAYAGILSSPRGPASSSRAAGGSQAVLFQEVQEILEREDADPRIVVRDDGEDQGRPVDTVLNEVGNRPAPRLGVLEREGMREGRKRSECRRG
jgi:hypothetical protein